MGEVKAEVSERREAVKLGGEGRRCHVFGLGFVR